MNLLIGLNNKKQMKAEYTQVVVNKAELLKYVIKEQLKKDVNRVNRDRLLIEARFIYFLHPKRGRANGIPKDRRHR